MKTAVKKSIRPMPRPTEERMGALRERARDAAEMERLEGKITGGTESEAIKQDLKAARSVPPIGLPESMPSRIRVTGSGGKNPGANLKPMVKKAGGSMAKKAGGSMVKGYAKGGCVMSGRGGKYKGSM